jgi:hypothetical protein
MQSIAFHVSTVLRLISLGVAAVAVVCTESMSRDLVACIEESKFGILTIYIVIKDGCSLASL